MDKSTTSMELGTPVAGIPASPQTASAPTPILTLTAAAMARVKAILAEQHLPQGYLVVRVVPAGCSGLGYDLGVSPDIKQGDATWEQDGVRMATDELSKKLLAGATLDFVKTGTSEGFRFSNPNAKSSCGCGSTFSA